MDYESFEGLDGLSNSDIIIAVLGVTGSGKSTFISTLTDLDTSIGSGLAPQTAGIDIYSYVQEDGRRVYLVDTPGFDDASRTDVDTLHEQAFFFTQLYRTNAPFVGIVYLHPISKNRVGGSTERNFRMLEQMCGFDALHRIVLLTTMWNQIKAGTPEHDIAYQRQRELIHDSQFWGKMCRRGSRAMQFDGGKRSALQVIDSLTARYTENRPAVFQIQRELVDEGKDIWASSAAGEVARELVRVREGINKEIGQLQSRQKEVEIARDHARASEIAEEICALEKGLQDAAAAHRQLRTKFSDVCTQKEAQFAHILRQSSREDESLAQEVQRQESRLQRLEEERQESLVIYQSYQSEREEILSQSQSPSSDESFESSYRQDQKRIQQDRRNTEKSVRDKRRRRIMVQNVVPMLQILGGVGCVAGGAVSMIAPLTAAGATLIAAGAAGLNFSMKGREKSNPQECSSD